MQELWNATEPLHKFISALILSGLTAYMLWFFRAKVSLVWGTTSTNYHRFSAKSADGHQIPIDVWTEKFFIQNVGRKPALSVEIVLSAPPTSHNLWPPRDHSVNILYDGVTSVKIPTIAPRELIILDIIDVNLRQVRILSVNCQDSLSRQVNFQTVRRYGNITNFIIVSLMSMGLVGCVYFVLSIVSFIF